MSHKLLLALLALTLHATAQFSTEKARELIDAYVHLDKISGAALVAQKGQVVFQEGYGYRDIPAKKRNDVNSIFQIGSVTKQFTSTVILQLQQEGKLSVRDKLSRYLPNFPHGDSITLENLLTHTSGIYNYTRDAAFMQTRATLPNSHEYMLHLFMDKPLGFPPGTKWEYSNSNYWLLGYIIEKVTGKPYEQVVRERILTPVGMTHSGFDFVHLGDTGKATGYFHIGKDPQPAPVVDSTASFAAGALYSTLVDLFLWDRALYTSRLLTTASLHQAFTPFKDKYGYGWFIDSLYGRPTVGHDGGIYGFTSLILRFPAEQAVIIILDNSNSPSLGELARKLAAILFGKPYQLPQPPHEAHVADSVLRPYAGRYQLQPGFIIDVTLENGALMAQATGQPKLRLYPESRTLFFIKEADAKLEFQPDSATGAVPQLILHQGGRDLPARRIN